MQLFLNATSPFARLVRMAALYKGLQSRIDLVWCDPWNNDPALLAAHPQGRIPVLVTDDGTAISESLLITHYLDQLEGHPSLCPANSAGVLSRTSMAYGLMESAFATVIARKHDAAADASLLGQRRVAAMARALAQLEINRPAAGSWTLDHLCLATALEYLEFRLPGTLSPQQHPGLCAWLSAMRVHPILHTTAFPS